MTSQDMLNQRTRIYRAVSCCARRLATACLSIGAPVRLRSLSSCTISFLFHVVLLVLLGIVGIWSENARPSHVVTVLPTEFVEEIPPLLEDLVAPTVAQPNQTLGAFAGDPTETELPHAPDIPSPFPAEQAGEATWDPMPVPQRLTTRDLLMPIGPVRGGGLEGRSAKMRRRLAEQRGGNEESERAVGFGLGWLVAHQRDDGSWRFDHRGDRCPSLCGNPGTEGSTTGATGLALLPFLGAGEIGEGSQYKEVVDKGLYYLGSRMLVTRHGGDLQEGTMYAQGIAATALCEAYAMTGDENLRPTAQLAIDFICSAQHHQGGWRYYPGQPGDMTVFGWQLLALKSAKLGGLRVPREVLDRAERFLDHVQSDEGAHYGYLESGKLPTPTAIGLLSRMYFDWPQDDPRLARGVEYLEKLGPSRTDVYFNYYATQVMHHYENAGWHAWNRNVRDRLIATQARRGHESGSWYFRDEHGKSGGRLYTTAMCIMILEVYYRHMPIYGERAVDEDL